MDVKQDMQVNKNQHNCKSFRSHRGEISFLQRSYFPTRDTTIQKVKGTEMYPEDEDVNPLRIIADDETKLYPQDIYCSIEQIYSDREESSCLRIVTQEKAEISHKAKSWKNYIHDKRKIIILVIVLILYFILNIVMTSILCSRRTEKVNKEIIPECSKIHEPIQHLQQDKQVNDQLVQQKEEELQHLKDLQEVWSKEQQSLKRQLRQHKFNQTLITQALNESQNTKREIENKLLEVKSELKYKEKIIDTYKQNNKLKENFENVQKNISDTTAEIYFKLLSKITNGEILNWRILLKIVKREMREHQHRNNSTELMVLAAHTELDSEDNSKMHVRYAHITLQNEMMHLHAFNYSQPLKNSLILPYKAIQDIIPNMSTLTFLDLRWSDHPPARVYIRLHGDTDRGKQFFWLCTGIKGPSYVGSHFDTVYNKGKAGEYIFGGNYDELRSPPLIQNLTEAGEYLKSSVAGLVTGVVVGDSTQNAKFGLYTRKEPNMNNVLGFGQVNGYKSMKVIKEAAKQSDITSVFIADSGVVIPV